MKKKLKTIFLLIVLSLAGIIIFQSYWTFNAYKANKVKFDNNIDSAMRLAMADCEIDYFDSMRVVLVKHLSPPAMKMIVDTFSNEGTITYNIWFLNAQTKVPSSFDPKYYRVEHITEPVGKILVTNNKIVITNTKPMRPTTTVTEANLNLYRKKIDHKATLPELLTEMSFYQRYMAFDITQVFFNSTYPMIMDAAALNAHINMRDYDDWIRITSERFINRALGFPPNFKQADSLRLSRYLNAELHKLGVYASFNLKLSARPIAPQKPNIHYSETSGYEYIYHGFNGFGIHHNNNFYVRAIFGNPQYTVLKSMVLTLVLSILLIALTIYCFLYITRTILEQKKLAELKDDFINNMTHELKTPIATITVAIEGMQKFNALNDPEKTKRYLQTSKEELARLNELVSKVLNVAAFENKEIVLVKEHIKVDELLNEVIEAEKSKAGKTVNISYNNPYNIETIVADRFHFRNVLINLIDNAIKYSDEPVDIAITCTRDGSHVVFSIKDNGIGIPPDHINQVFNKFHRVPTGNIHNVKGTGLGLSYVKFIAEAHGGSVTAKSETNKGSEFIVTLPLANG